MKKNLNRTHFQIQISVSVSNKSSKVIKKDFSLVPSKYIEFVNRDENIDFDEKMQTLKGEFADLLKAEANSKSDLLKVK